jgi:aspartyl-tRNA(Asn)/glutamyl-tRNA(Gln) amidotransferase subunit A
VLTQIAIIFATAMGHTYYGTVLKETTMNLVADPLAKGGLDSFGRRLRAGEITSEQATAAYLTRIETLDRHLGAFQHLAGDHALATAKAMDQLLANGVDLGPLMGVPIAVKDLFAVDGMPTTAGSKLDVSDLIGSEGSFVKSLKRAGCVILGKTKTVEFAFGITGASTPRGTPWNPWDAGTQRVPGGSSSGSAVAVAAGLCAWAVGSDTGGSVRVPAALCGVFGLKTTFGLWPTDGVFPLAPNLDTIGLLTKSANDAAIAFSALTGRKPAQPAHLRRLRFGRSEDYFFRNIDPTVSACTSTALSVLERNGVEITANEVPEAKERANYFPVALPASLIALLGRERFLAGRDQMDAIVRARGESGLNVQASDYIRLELKRKELAQGINQRFSNLDAWVSPMATVLPFPMADLNDPQRSMALTLGMSQNSQPLNYLELCGATLPIQQFGSPLPVGLQIICPAGAEMHLLAIAQAVEAVIGEGAPPSLDGFLGRKNQP